MTTDLLQELKKDFFITSKTYLEAEENVLKKLYGKSLISGENFEINLFFMISPTIDLSIDFVGKINDHIQIYYHHKTNIVMHIRELPCDTDFNIMIKMLVNVKI